MYMTPLVKYSYIVGNHKKKSSSFFEDLEGAEVSVEE